MTKLALALLAFTALVRPVAAAPVVSEGFENTWPATGWDRQNHSSSLGSNPNWDQYAQDAITPHGGTKYLMADYNSVGPHGTISNWLITPEVTLVDGVTMSFWTFSGGAGSYADRLEVRMSTAGASVDVGTIASSVGDFTTLLLEINPNLTTTDYPTVWTEYVVTVTGIPVATTGRFAFRYSVPDAGPGGTNGAAVMLDDVAITSLCGNGAVTNGEACDDGNSVDGDGCDSNCTATACGNGIVTNGEACDDGNSVEGDGCDTNCTASACGNGIVSTGEACDDGNTADGDGCDTNCTATACGNGIVSTGEACDDGNTVDGDGCESDCTMVAAARCGDQVVDADEACDDGNTVGGDGCNSTCDIEEGWRCEYGRDRGSVCQAFRGGGCSVGLVSDRRGAFGSAMLMFGLVGLDVLRRRRARRSAAANRTDATSR